MSISTEMPMGVVWFCNENTCAWEKFCSLTLKRCRVNRQLYWVQSSAFPNMKVQRSLNCFSLRLFRVWRRATQIIVDDFSSCSESVQINTITGTRLWQNVKIITASDGYELGIPLWNNSAVSHGKTSLHRRSRIGCYSLTWWYCELSTTILTRNDLMIFILDKNN